jgi:putative transposase
MIRAHEIRLHPTPEQAVYFVKAAGAARCLWDWALTEWVSRRDTLLLSDRGPFHLIGSAGKK